MLGPEYPQIASAIPDDHARESRALDMLAEAVAARQPVGPKVLDFGCGAGTAIESLRRILPDMAYHGVDIEGSPEVAQRIRSDASFTSYDGYTLPFEDASFDIVYTHQVFEHVRHPDRLVQEIHRVLVPGGVFAGSWSNLEPYHSFSIFMFTPYGSFRLLTDNGFLLDAMRPGAEGIGVIVRQLTLRRIGRFRLAYPAFRLAARLRGWDARRLNYLMLRFSGHICFRATKPRA